VADKQETNRQRERQGDRESDIVIQIEGERTVGLLILPTNLFLRHLSALRCKELLKSCFSAKQSTSLKILFDSSRLSIERLLHPLPFKNATDFCTVLQKFNIRPQNTCHKAAKLVP